MQPIEFFSWAEQRKKGCKVTLWLFFSTNSSMYGFPKLVSLSALIELLAFFEKKMTKHESQVLLMAEDDIRHLMMTR